MTWTHGLNRWRRTEAWETILCAGLLVVAEIGLRVLTLPRLAGLMRVGLSHAQVPVAAPALMPHWTKRCLSATHRVTRRWPAGPDGKCLRAALVAGNRLRSLDPQLVIGVRRGADRLQAHAWLVVCGGSLDPTADDFVQMTADVT